MLALSVFQFGISQTLHSSGISSPLESLQAFSFFFLIKLFRAAHLSVLLLHYFCFTAYQPNTEIHEVRIYYKARIQYNTLILSVSFDRLSQSITLGS